MLGKSTLCTIFAWFLGVCYGFVLLSSVAGQNGDLKVFQKGESASYRLRSSAFLKEKSAGDSNVGFLISGDVVVSVIGSVGNKKLLKVEIKDLRLNLNSRKNSQQQFTPHASQLDNAIVQPFLIIWENGRIDDVFMSKNETTSLRNLKKGIASLFQFQISSGEYKETDASGLCVATYNSASPTKLIKTKTACLSEDLKSAETPDEILGIKLQSSRQVEYEIDGNLEHIQSREFHTTAFSAMENIGTELRIEQNLTLIKSGQNVKTFHGNTLEDVVEKFVESEGGTYAKESLLTEPETVGDATSNFFKQVHNLRDYLKTENVGTLKPAKAFLKLVSVGRNSKKDDILKAIQSKKNKDISLQLLDVLGHVQTDESHAAVLKAVHLDKDDQIDSSERYLWALSFSPSPNQDIVKDLLKRFLKGNNIPDKVKETLVLTLASMANKLSEIHGRNLKVVRDVEEAVLNSLDYAKNDDRHVFLRALKNLQSPKTIPVLLNYIKTGTQKEGVLAWKAIRSFPRKFWDESVQKCAEKSIFQLDRKYDPSSRSQAVDILLETRPSEEMLGGFLNFVTSNDTAYEVRQMIFQKINMLASKDEEFDSTIRRIVKSNPRLNNYSLSPRGLSTAIMRRFLTGPSTNGSLVSLQDIQSGMVKMGVVNVMMERGDLAKEIFSLGIFSGGLHSFVSSNNEIEDNDEEVESVTAGMELTVMGTQIRPFTFFNGQGELMGHVWSGTASEKTPAFQVLALLHDHYEHLRLGSGFIVTLSLKEAVSFELSGRVSMSLWNRNAESQIQKSAGILIAGNLALDTSFVKSQVEFTGALEAELNLQSNIDFSSNVRVCMRLTQPNTVFRYNIYKTEIVPGSKYNLRISNYRKTNIPGLTYALNRKNNEMCSLIFS